MSIKDNARRALVMTTVAALSTTFFAGCNKELPKPAELDLDSELYSSSSKQSSSNEDTLAVSSEDTQTSSDEDKDDRSTSGSTNILEAVVKGSSNEDNNSEESSNKDNNGEDVSGDVSADIENADKTQTSSGDKQSPSDEDNKLSQESSSSKEDSSKEDSSSSNKGSTSNSKPQSSSSKEDSSKEDSSKEDSSKEDTKPQPKWTETPTSGTMYVNMSGVYSRAEGIVGSQAVKQYSLNDAVTVVATTNTGYYKLNDGNFIHSDYLSLSPIEVPVYTPPVETPAQPSSSGSTGSGNTGAGSGNAGGGNAGNTGSTGGNAGGGNAGNTGTTEFTPSPSSGGTGGFLDTAKPTDDNHDIFGNEVTGPVEMPGGTYWEAGGNYFKTKEDAQYWRNVVPQGEVDGEDPSGYADINWNF